MTTRDGSRSNGIPLGITAGGSRDRHEAYAASICRFRKKIDPFASGEEFEANAFYFIAYLLHFGCFGCLLWIGVYLAMQRGEVRQGSSVTVCLPLQEAGRTYNI